MQRESPFSGCFQAKSKTNYTEGRPGTIETTLCDIKLTLAPSEILDPTTLGDVTSQRRNRTDLATARDPCGIGF